MVISTASGHTNPQPTVDTKVPLVSNQLTDGTEQQNGPMNCEERAVRVVRRELVLDRTAEPNALPFVLQGYVAWIGRVALDPIKLQYTARDFVLSHFGDGDESRWIVGLIANIGSRIGSMEFVGGEPNLMLSMLQAAVRRRLGSTSSKRAALAKALNSAIEAMLIHFHASPLSETVTLRQEAAPIFRQLYSASPGAPIDLYSLIQHPCLWHYAFIDILFGVATDMPTLFRYEVSFPSHQHSTTYQGSQGDGIIQWLHGIPNQLLFVFAYMKLMRGDGLTPNDDTVASLERTIHELPPFDGSSSNRFVSVIRSVVQECWKQAALIYLYMAVCGDSSATPRVKEACKRYMRLLNSTQPGRLPDEHLVLTLQLVSPAAQRQRDRAVIKQRALGLYTRDRTHRETTLFLFVMDDVWTRADTEDRPVMWSDVAVSQKRILGA
ncbi:unnamed protein product [Rhizoctonia solani]|uniref:Fungal-specific transcription factor domain protein n=1 Tax=Rhizoctonia solani TaxID=456999 RepID=A0A8H3C5T6_9AGAM|nr:unnamed protein product [Rhizoctonia solani]